MAEEKKVVKGGFRATLALLIAIIALILSIVSFNRTGGRADLDAEIKSLQSKIKELKEEGAVQMDKVLQETKKAVEKIGKTMKKE